MTDQEKALKDGLRQLKYEQLNEEYRQLTQQLMELEKEDVGEVGAKKSRSCSPKQFTSAVSFHFTQKIRPRK